MGAGFAIRLIIVVVAGYLIGGVSWAYLIGKRFYGIDVREHGSGNLGATNVLRTLGAKAAIFTLLLDAAKGALAVALALWLVPHGAYGDAAGTWAMIGATMAAILGHSYSPYIRFRGGKGIATAAGALLILTPYPWPFLVLTFALVVAIWRIVSLGSVIVAFEYPLLCLVFYRHSIPTIAFACVAAALVIWRHRANIGRLWRREEPTVSFRWHGSEVQRERKP